MRLTVKRLRHWILLAAGFLVVVLGGYFFHSMFSFSREVKDLPQALGANIEQTANGYTYSQSSGGHTLFTIHASKLMAYRNGQALLHEVAITLYGPVGTHRKDKIRGTEFSYNPKTGLAQSEGKVEIALQGPSSANGSEAQTILIETSGLSFDSKSGIALTKQYAEFATPKGSGHAVGASYDSRSGLLVLASQVFLKGETAAKTPIEIHASGLKFWRNQEQAVLTQTTWTLPGKTGTSDQATLDFRKDGTVEGLEAQGHVHLVTTSGTNVKAQEATASFDAKSQPELILLSGAVQLLSHNAAQQMQGAAQQARLTFASFGKFRLLAHVLLLGTKQKPVDLDQKSLASHARGAEASRHLTGEVVNVYFAPAPDGRKSLAERVVLDHNASIVLHTPTAAKSATQTASGRQTAGATLTTITGDHLVATLTGGNTLSRLDGLGHTVWTSVGQNKATTTLTGDQLHLTFSPAGMATTTVASGLVSRLHALVRLHRPSSAPSGTASATASRTEISTATMSGHVVLDQQPALQSEGQLKKQLQQAYSQAEPVHAWASEAVYQAATQTVRLLGNPRLEQGKSLQVAAKQIDLNRATGQALAIGKVKVTYRDPGPQQASQVDTDHAGLLHSSEPVHAIAERAEFDRATGKVFFYGSGLQTARLWQAGNAVWSPVIELDQQTQQLQAYGDAADGGSMASPAVRAYFSAILGAGRQSGLVRVVSNRLRYSDASRVADFTGRVEAVDAMGTLLANSVSMHLSPAHARLTTRQSSSTQLEQMTALGGVHLVQAGREAVGQKLVYTARDERFVLTGAPKALPYLLDREHGRTSGNALIFNNQNDSVEIIRGEGSAVTVTRAPR